MSISKRALRISFGVIMMVVICCVPVVYANTVFTQATALINQVMSFFQGIVHAGLVIGVGWGAFTRFTAGGDHQIVMRADSIMKGSFIAWAVFTAIALITRTLTPYLQ
ncbi:MAG: hypothetical protein FWE76_01990 [Symbiobacteriaceae bacterium]|nr:hypothetical protein [Symbiobacteriaceae bacterium]